MKAQQLPTKTIFVKFTLLLFTLLLLSNCTKREEETTNSELVGTWKFAKGYADVSTQAGNAKVTWTGSTTITFKADKTFTSNSAGGTFTLNISGQTMTDKFPGSSGSGTYEYNPSTKKLKSSGTISGYGSTSGEADVTELSSNSLKLKSSYSGSEGSGTAYLEYTR